MSVVFLDADQIVAMHEVLLERWGGASGGGHRGQSYQGADAAVQAVKNSYYESLEELAAAYAVYIVQGHVFMDGNKRTGAAALTTFLEVNDHPSKVSPSRLQSIMIELQERSESGERTDTLIAWIAKQI